MLATVCQVIIATSFEWSGKTLKCLQVRRFKSLGAGVQGRGMRGGKAGNLEKRAWNKKMEAKSKDPHAKPAQGPKVSETAEALGRKTAEGLAIRTESITSQ